ncbi:MAG: hypothetical protein ACK4PG_02370 [Acetobacteraceae bacterium]
MTAPSDTSAATTEPAAAQPPPKPQAPAMKDLPPTHPVTVQGRRSALTFQVADVPGGEVYFCLGVRKSGSTLLNRIVQPLARRNGINAVNIPATFFTHGLDVDDWADADLRDVVLPGNIYVGFRSFPANIAGYPRFEMARKVFMFRDPRDALVSQYYSDAYSHVAPAGDTEASRQHAEMFEKRRAEARATPIDDYVLKRARSMDQTLRAFAGLLGDPRCLPLRYEDYVFQKPRLIHKILRHFDWTCPPGAIEGLLKQVDEVPESEDPQRFVRRVIPGDHRKKLSPQTINKLNRLLGESMQAFDYY